MATSRARISKRGSSSSSSSSSYASTITTLVFIALCIVGVWMLTSNSVVPPQTTSRAAITDTDLDAAASSFTAAEVDVSSVTSEAQNSVISAKKDLPIFEDNPGDLPDDAIKSDEPKTGKVNDKEGSKQEEEKGKEQGNDKSVVAEDSQHLKRKESAEEQEKQNGRETQISEESTITQKQQLDQTRQASNESETTQQTESMESQEQTTTPENLQESRAQISDDNHEKNKEQPQNTRDSSNENGRTQNLKSLEEEQQKQKQKQEDAGIQDTNVSEESQNVISDQDQQKTTQQQKQESSQDSSSSNETSLQQQQSTVHEFEDVTIPKTEQINDQELEAKTQVGNQETQQEESNSNKETKQPIKPEDKTTESNSGESATLPAPVGGNSEIPKESNESKKSWSTQATESENQKERRNRKSDGREITYGHTWQLCNVTAGPDYIPCLDNEKALKLLRSTKHFEHRERHCPEEGPTCLVPLPQGYKKSITWPKSRDKVWYHNVPHKLLAEVKGHQNWVKISGEFWTFPGGGTQFIHGALHYIDFLQQAVSKIAWGKRTRVVLDVGCGVASFGGYLFDRDVLTMSFAPKDEHEAQVQFALERGIPAISAVMGSQRLPFPTSVFDLVHCARCRVPWHEEGGKLLLELNRVLRPGGYFVWSATPVYRKRQEDVEIWQAMSALTVSMCWELITIKKDDLNLVAAAIYRKPSFNDCYNKRKQNAPPMCKNSDDPNAAWYVPMQACMHKVPVDKTERGGRWPEEWPSRLQTPPYWLNSSQIGIYGKPAPQDFAADYEHWKHIMSKSYLKELGIRWSNVRNVMDMRAVYGGFAAALKDMKVWVMNVVNVDSPDTLPIIYERGLFGIYHDWCESFSTYPRTYDLLHADQLFSKLKKRCKLVPVIVEIDRILRPGGNLVIRDESSTIGEVENLLKSLHWEVNLSFSQDQQGLLSAQKGEWRPNVQGSKST